MPVNVKLVNFVGGDETVVQSAQVSTLGDRAESKVNAGLINYLMRERHASPFEHSVFTFYVHAPIFVTREMLRHRTASINEESGRYRELDMVFYYPDDPSRPLRQIGKTGNYEFEQGEELREAALAVIDEAYGAAEIAYERLLAKGVAKEVARMVLPVGIYSSLYFTVNARGLINFLALRTASNAQWEIQQIADTMAVHFADKMPVTYDAWYKNGRGSL